MKSKVIFYKKNKTKTAFHPNCKVFTVYGGGGNGGLWLFVASGPGQLAIIDRTSLSGHFAEECKAICSPIDTQQKLGDATRLLPKAQE